jgi:hypothetical protein
MLKIVYLMLSLELTISSKDREKLFLETKLFIKKHDLNEYKSDVVSYIDGIQALSAHLTIFYGLKELDANSCDDLEMISKISKRLADTKKISFNGSELIIKHGYQSLYSILLLKLDLKNNLFLGQAYQTLASLNHHNIDSNLKSENGYEPHITLAYIQNTDLSSDNLNLNTIVNFANLDSLEIGQVNLVL